MVDEGAIAAKYQMLAGQLDERGLRLWAAAEANACGWGGVSAVSRATGIARSTIGRGDPELPLRWTAKSLRTLAGELRAIGHEISANSIAPLLRRLGYSLQANRKAREGASHPDRDAQFRHINQQVSAALASGQPAISVDTSCRRRHEVSNADLAVMAISV